MITIAITTPPEYSLKYGIGTGTEYHHLGQRYRPITRSTRCKTASHPGHPPVHTIRMEDRAEGKGAAYALTLYDMTDCKQPSINRMKDVI